MSEQTELEYDPAQDPDSDSRNLNPRIGDQAAQVEDDEDDDIFD